MRHQLHWLSPLVVFVLVATMAGLGSFVENASAQEPAKKVAKKSVAEPVPPISVKDKFPTVGKATTIVTDRVRKKLSAIYSPESRGSTTEPLVIGGTNLVLWRPEKPGVVRIQIEEPGQDGKPVMTSKDVSVRFDGVPTGGVVIMLLAGLILFGGAFISLRALLASGK